MLGEMTLEDAARLAAGNWRSFDSFAWFRDDIPDPENWAIVYTSNRGSDLLAVSNADALRKAMEPFSEADAPDVVFESNGHWAVGHVDGFSIRVYRDGEITDAFKSYHDLGERLADYPVLDEEDYSRREHEATLTNITEAGWRLRHEYGLPDGWQGDVFSWLSEHRQRAVENRATGAATPKRTTSGRSLMASSTPGYEPGSRLRPSCKSRRTLVGRRQTTPNWNTEMTADQAESIAVGQPQGLDEFFSAYIEAALWSSTDNADDNGGDPLDRNYGADDIAPETLDKMRADCAAFLNHKLGGRLVAIAERLYADGEWALPGGADCSIAEYAGHDFWLTRNGHGCGYWDGEWPKGVAEGLDKLAHEFGSFDLYVGDDGLIHGA
jgi:hypothetical protein